MAPVAEGFIEHAYGLYEFGCDIKVFKRRMGLQSGSKLFVAYLSGNKTLFEQRSDRLKHARRYALGKRVGKCLPDGLTLGAHEDGICDTGSLRAPSKRDIIASSDCL